MTKKLNVAILCGGKSAEHEISLISGKNIYDAIDKEKYHAIIITITHEGIWHLRERHNFLSNEHDPKTIKLTEIGEVLEFRSGATWQLINSTSKSPIAIDVIFPILHGPYGEDGTLQGLLRFFNIPFVGADVLGASVGMDKVAMKNILKANEIKIGEYLYFLKNGDQPDYDQVIKALGLPLFVKPANMGSSVGISMVKNREQFHPAIQEAFRYDNKIIIEKFIDGRELECAVMGNNSPTASAIGEVIPKDKFYSYESKYIDENGAELKIPAELNPHQIQKIQEAAIKTFLALDCKGFARVDVFLSKEDIVYINEINTHPGFTSISMYPKLWEVSGVKYQDTIDKLIHLAIEHHRELNQLQIKKR